MRHSTQWVILLAAATIFLIPFAASAPPHLSHGTIQHSCAPWDGPALEISLTSEPRQCKPINGPYLEIDLWRGLPIHAGQEVKLAATSQTGFAARCSKWGNCEPAESGTIVFEKYQNGSGAQGRYELRFKGNAAETGTFNVKWCETHILCR